MKVGPRSAGGHPGPVCYGQGGTEPTVTDANLVLGRLVPDRFLGGEMPLDAGAAWQAIEDKIGKPLGLSVESAAAGIVRIAIAEMALAVQSVSIGRGHDPRDFAMVAFGGAGPLHACEIARELHIPRVIVPRVPGHFSALGMLLADLRHDYVRTYYKPLDACDFAALTAIFEVMARGGRGAAENRRRRSRGHLVPVLSRYALHGPGVPDPDTGVARPMSPTRTSRRSGARSISRTTGPTGTRRSTSRSRS